RRLLEHMRSDPNMVDVDRSLISGKPEVRVEIDRRRAADLGVRVADIAQTIGADRVIYQSYKGLVEAVSGGRQDLRFCTACFSGEYPTLVSSETLSRLERERCRWSVGRGTVAQGDKERGCLEVETPAE
ncbi:MAG: hypothetical protein ABIK62_07910, partial [candidate division WOR-3 bacterium]